MTPSEKHSLEHVNKELDLEGAAACQALLQTHSFAAIEHFASIDSTNTRALADLEKNGSSDLPSLYVADCQTSGRGRHGRTWVSDPGTLTFTVVVPIASATSEHSRSSNVAPVSIAVGVAIARTIEHLAPPYQARLKWPNDVHLNDRKVAGILIETTPKHPQMLVIGVGLNVATKLGASNRQVVDASIQSSAISVCELTQRFPRRYQWLGECVEQIFDALDQCVQSPHEIIEEQRRRCVLRDQWIRYCIADQWLTGKCEGVDDVGRLRVRTDGALRLLASGEVQRVRGTN